MPREFPPHPAAEWLKLQSFTARVPIDPSVVTSPRLVDRLCRDLEVLEPLVRWLNRALDPASAVSPDALAYYLYGAADIGTDILDDTGTFNVGGTNPSTGFVPPLPSAHYTWWVQAKSRHISPSATHQPMRAPVLSPNDPGVPDGTLLGRVVLPELPANVGSGEDGTVLFLTARTSVYRLPTKTRGTLPG